MQLTLTAKIKIVPGMEQEELLRQTTRAYRDACNAVSEVVFNENKLVQAKLHRLTYRKLRADFGLKAQMAQSVLKTVIARYKTNKSNGHKRSCVQFKKPQLDLVFNRDYSITNGLFSVNTLEGRIKVPFHTEGLESYFDGTWTFGTAKLVMKHGKWFLHIPVSQDLDEPSLNEMNQVVGIDMGVNFTATTYDSQGTTRFFNGKPIKHQRARYKQPRRELQHKQTASARQRLKAMGQRENRWMQDVNHCISKALVETYGTNTLFVLEDLHGVRQATEKVNVCSRYQMVSWSFYDLRQKIEYKAVKTNAVSIAVDPKHTSQTCPKCGHTARANRNKRTHTFQCQNCRYTSNDDRIAAMNLQRKGIEYIVEETTRT